MGRSTRGKAHRKGKAKRKTKHKNKNHKKGIKDVRWRFRMDVAAYILAAIAGVLFVLVGIFYAEHKTPSIILFGSACLFLTVAACLYWANAIAGPSETPISGVLIPASEPVPPNQCDEMSGVPSDAVVLLLGNVSAYTVRFPMVVLRVGKLNLLTIKKNSSGGLALSAKVFSRDLRIVADLEDNEFHVNPNNYFKIKRPNRSTLTVYDQQGNVAIAVRYLNPRVIRVTGTFCSPTYEPIIIDETSVTPLFGTSTICIGEVGVAAIGVG